MEAFFRAIAIGLGVLLGTFQPGADPELGVTVRRSGEQVAATAVLGQPVGPALVEALGEGVPLALTFQVGVGDHPGGPLTQTLASLPLTGEWLVSGPGEARRTFPNRAQAVAAWAACPLPGITPPQGGPFTLEVSVTLTFPDRPEWKADLVWKQPTVRWRKTFQGLSEIPF